MQSQIFALMHAILFFFAGDEALWWGLFLVIASLGATSTLPEIAAAGARETQSNDEAAPFFYVFASRHDEGIAEKFAETIAEEVARGRRAIVADIDTRGDVQGGDETFTEALLAHGVFPQ